VKNYDIDMFKIIETIFYLMCLDDSSKPTMEKNLFVCVGPIKLTNYNPKKKTHEGPHLINIIDKVIC